MVVVAVVVRAGSSSSSGSSSSRSSSSCSSSSSSRSNSSKLVVEVEVVVVVVVVIWGVHLGLGRASAPFSVLALGAWTESRPGSAGTSVGGRGARCFTSGDGRDVDRHVGWSRARRSQLAESFSVCTKTCRTDLMEVCCPEDSPPSAEVIRRHSLSIRLVERAHHFDDNRSG